MLWLSVPGELGQSASVMGGSLGPRTYLVTEAPTQKERKPGFVFSRGITCGEST